MCARAHKSSLLSQEKKKSLISVGFALCCIWLKHYLSFILYMKVGVIMLLRMDSFVAYVLLPVVDPWRIGIIYIYIEQGHHFFIKVVFVLCVIRSCQLNSNSLYSCLLMSPCFFLGAYFYLLLSKFTFPTLTHEV